MTSKRYSIASARDDDDYGCNICSFSNFNGIAPLSLVLFLISIVLAGTALGLDRWSRQEVDRGNGLTTDSSTRKIQGLSMRCVRYTLSDELLQLNLPSEQIPQDGCIMNSELSCSNSMDFLLSAHDSPDVEELQNTDSTSDCETVRTRLMVSLSFMIIAIIVTFVGVIFVFPLFHRWFFLIGALCGFVGAVCFAIALGVYEDSDPDFAGFFSLNGRPTGGCIDASYGLAIGSIVINIIGTIVATIAFCYKYISSYSKSNQDD